MRMINVQRRRQDALPFWLSREYRRALLTDAVRAFEMSLHIADRARRRELCIEGARLLRRRTQNFILRRHIAKHEALWEALSEHPPRVIVEVGAYDGLDALEMSRMFPRAQVFTFEADPHNFQLLKRVTALRSQVKPIHQAVLDFTGEGIFHSSDSRDKDHPDSYARASGSMLMPTEKFASAFPDLQFVSKHKVPTTTLKDWAHSQGIKQIDVLWMDAQGAELAILRGAGDLLQGTKIVLTEVWRECWYSDGASLSEIEAYLQQFQLDLSNLWMEGSAGDALFKKSEMPRAASSSQSLKCLDRISLNQAEREQSG